MLAEAHGWSDNPLVAIAHAVRGRYDASIAEFRAAEPAGEMLASPHAVGARFGGALSSRCSASGNVAAVERRSPNSTKPLATLQRYVS